MRWIWFWIAVLLGMGPMACSDGSSSGGEHGGKGTDAQGPGNGGGVRDADVCKFTDPVSLGPPDAEGMVDVPANHPDIFYMGRIDCSNPLAPAFAFPGVSIRARFQGDALDMRLKDYGNAAVINYYNVMIDGGEPTVLEVAPDVEIYSLARGLPDAEHTVEIFKRIESGPSGTPNAGRADFLGFRIRQGRQLLEVAAKPHRLEFIGDSITCGYGNGIATNDPDSFPYTTKNSNAYTAYSAVVARNLNAEYLAVAYSGRGVNRNYDDYVGATLPEMYLSTLPDDPTGAEWEISRYTPELVVINLGTNDFSEGLAAEEVAGMREQFRREYLLFLETLRGYYPDAVFILAVGPMLNNSWPPGYAAWTSIQEDVGAMVSARRQAGDADIHFLAHTPQQSPYGEDWHPTEATHNQMATELLELIDSLALF